MKRITATILVTILMITGSIAAFASESAEALYLNGLGVLRGTDVGLELDRPITRAESVCLIFRLHPENPGVLGMPAPIFSDMDNHWAYKEVTAAKKIGLIDGTTETTFTPDRQVTGKEFAKILLSMLGYHDITIDNVYENAIAAELITDDDTKNIVSENSALIRDDAAKLCYAVLRAKMPDGTLFYEKLVANGRFKAEDFE